jgi:hypothetical protein
LFARFLRETTNTHCEKGQNLHLRESESHRRSQSNRLFECKLVLHSIDLCYHPSRRNTFPLSAKETMMFKIEKGIPFTGRRNTKYPWGQMEVGDSIFFGPSYKVATVRQSAYKYAKAAGKTFKVGVVDGGFRVWRMA